MGCTAWPYFSAQTVCSVYCVVLYICNHSQEDINPWVSHTAYIRQKRQLNQSNQLPAFIPVYTICEITDTPLMLDKTYLNKFTLLCKFAKSLTHTVNVWGHFLSVSWVTRSSAACFCILTQKHDYMA